jgi:uncharacterized lipoprotein YddW (UPF0748 family)
MRRFLPITVLAIFAGLLPALAAEGAKPPAVPREFRAVWVATVSNIDWPSKKGLSAEEQKAELKAILDKCVDTKLNAVILQVRPMADALYKSDLEPWSEFLTGTSGKDPGYDPLEFAIREAHARGLQLHAWFNPYRAWSGATSRAAENHLVKARPDLAKSYGQYHWLNPTHKDVQEHSLKVFFDVVKRYDVDGVHMDDYFYPYPDYGGGKQFPDDDTWEAYQKSGGKLERNDWRRAAVDHFVEQLYKGTKALKPWVLVGISPFGIWRPGYPEGIKGFDQYDKLYADAKLWLNKGWVDYWTPQLYWPINKPEQSYPKLLGWWVGENTHHRNIWPGQTVRHGPKEIVDQLEVTRKQPGASGNVYFSMKSILHNRGGIADALKAAYGEPALVPASPWLGDKPPAKPEVARDGEALTVKLGDGVQRVVVRSKAGDKWDTQLLAPADGAKTVVVKFATPPERTLVTVVDRIGLESDAVEVKK